MVGIVSYGGYIPRYRIDRKIIYKAMGWLNPATYMPGEKAVASCDEDSLTMAVSAGMDCLTDVPDRKDLDALYFASTTNPYMERQSSGLIAAACDLPSDIRTADFADTIKAGTTAMLSACDAAEAGTLKNVVVCASDCRIGKPGSPQEEFFGDGAASFLIGSDGVIASFEGASSVSYDFVDHWRGAGHKFDLQWEDRFIRDAGYGKFIIESISGLLKKCNVDIKDVAKVAYPCLYGGDHKKIGKKLGLEPSQVQDPMIANVGYTGTSNPLMMLVAALEDAKPGDKIIVASFGNGSDALLFQVTDEIEKIRGKRKGIKKNLAAKRPLDSYEKMITFNDILPVEKGVRGGTIPTFVSHSEEWRNHRGFYSLCGTKCTSCGTPVYPAQRVCVNPDCGAINQMEDYRFSDRKATVFTYTGDNLAYTLNPPAVIGVADFEGGGRYWFDMTDIDLESVSVGMEVEFGFRKKFVDEKFGQSAYFWKMIPVME